MVAMDSLQHIIIRRLALSRPAIRLGQSEYPNRNADRELLEWSGWAKLGA